MRLKPFVLALVAVLSSQASAFADGVENPAYKSWSACKPGTSIVLKMSGMTDITMTTTLVSVAADKCVVTIDMTVKGNKMPSRNQDVERQITDADAAKKLQDQMANADDQTVTVPAGTFKCKHVRVPNDTGYIEVWMSDEVPGSNVKTIIFTQMLKSTQTMELQSINKA